MKRFQIKMEIYSSRSIKYFAIFFIILNLKLFNRSDHETNSSFQNNDDNHESDSSENKTIVRNLSKNFRTDFTLDSSGTLPYISGANLILIADFVYDFYIRNVEPVSQMKNGDIVYVKTDNIHIFFKKKEYFRNSDG